MERYGIIVTEKSEDDDSAIHWLKRGTVVQIVGENEIECVAPCYPVNVAIEQMSRRKHRQYVNPDDVLEIHPDQVAALRQSS